MSMASFERKILAELRIIAVDRSLKMKHVMEWSTAKITPREGETLYYLPMSHVWAVVKKD